MAKYLPSRSFRRARQRPYRLPVQVGPEHTDHSQARPAERTAEETVEVLEQPDPTWQLEYDHFLALCGTAGTNLENDVWIHEKIRELGGSFEQVHP